MQQHCTRHRHDGTNAALSHAILVVSADAAECNLLVVFANLGNEFLRRKRPIVSLVTSDGDTAIQQLTFELSFGT
jgi:hypothetical protein